LVIIATCDPYDFLDENDIKNYITIYEPTIPAFKSAVDVIFGVTKATGVLPVGQRQVQTDTSIRRFDGSERDITQIWTLWQKIFPRWHIEQKRLSRILGNQASRHFVHDNGFCLSFVGGGIARISIIGVLPEYRRNGIGTALINRAVYELKLTSTDTLPLAIGSSFPRLWPYVPVDFPAETREFFLHRGTFCSLFFDSKEIGNVQDVVYQICTRTVSIRIVHRICVTQG
jgi:beta-N-acetylhexosaminidase